MRLVHNGLKPRVVTHSSLEPVDPVVRLQPIDVSDEMRARQPIQSRERLPIDERPDAEHLRIPVTAAHQNADGSA